MAKFFLTTFLRSLLHFIAFLRLTAGAVGDHMLFPNQPLAVGETLISHNLVFEMGFFSPGNSLKRFLGIWYKSTPDVVVWVANRNNPIAHSQEAILMISDDGSLVISSGGINFWSSSSSPEASNPVLYLLDSGNLVLVDSATEEESYVWQSFDYPVDTLLPGMKLVDDKEGGVLRNLTSWRNSDDPSPGDFLLKIENRGLAELVTLKGASKIYRLGQWNGMYFGGGPRFPSSIYKPEIVFRERRLVSIGEPYQSSVLVRVSLDTSGSIMRHTMNARKEKWNLAVIYPQDACDQYSSCGPNSICRARVDRPTRCHCLKGFAPKFQKDWDLQDWSGGCVRTNELNCEVGDGFVEVRGVKYPDMLSYWLSGSMSLDECRTECLKRCCIAYANAFITNGSSGCLMWFSDLIDTRELSAPHSKQNLYIRVPVSELEVSTGVEEDGKEKEEKEKAKEKKRYIMLILISIASGVLVSAFINGGVLYMTRRKRQAVKRNNEDLELPIIKISIIIQATKNFSRENKIGGGGFGPVYKGIMPSGEEIAVKRLSKTSAQGLEEFKNEVMVIAKLQHRNLVRLFGCCIEEEERMLIYEYQQNKSLDYFVFEHDRRSLLTWPKRYDIIIGIARGLLYLHHDSRLKIIHRDLKTSNILLDGNLNPKISDFGLARIFEEDQSLARTKRVVGTYGYMAPEYAIDGKFSEKSDIFSLGVVLLEIISGRKNRGFVHCDHYLNLLGHAWLLWKDNKIMEFMDECLKDTCVESEVRRCVVVGLLCVQRFAEDRPTVSSVVSMLGSDGEILIQPKEPGFFMERSPRSVRSFTSPSESENGTVSITDLEAR